jgi:hypothetical protein
MTLFLNYVLRYIWNTLNANNYMYKNIEYMYFVFDNLALEGRQEARDKGRKSPFWAEGSLYLDFTSSQYSDSLN